MASPIDVVNTIKSLVGKNQYTNGEKRVDVFSGYSDCSSLVWACYLKVGVDIGYYTGAQILSTELYDVNCEIFMGVPDESKMQIGDLLFFRKSTSKYPYKVSHVEMYIGNNQLCGHGSGTGPTVKKMTDYCQYKFEVSRDLIVVRRAKIFKDYEIKEASTVINTKNFPRLSKANKENLDEKAVKVWQSIIGVKIDGRFGPDTEKETINFEKSNGIYDNPEIVGPKAWKAGLETLI